LVSTEKKQRRSYEMPPAKKTEKKPVTPAVVEFETPLEKLENRVIILEGLVAKLYGQHYGGIYKVE